jgi:hypothetical protein
VNEARDMLMEAVKISGPVQAMSQDLLNKVNAARGFEREPECALVGIA